MNSINSEATEIFDLMPFGSKDLVAKDYGCGSSYFSKKLFSIKTPKEELIKMVESIAGGCNSYQKKVEQINKEVQSLANEFIKKYSN